MRDLDMVCRSKGIDTHDPESSICKEANDQFHFGKKETSQITEAPVSMVLDSSQAVTTGQKTLFLLRDALCLSLGRVDTASSPMDLNTKACVAKNSACDVTDAFVDDNSKHSLFAKQDKDTDLNFVTRGTGLDLNAEDISNSVDQDPFYPYKIQGHVKSRVASECGSSTGPLEENDSFRVWNEMKRNGFLSSSHGSIPIPKQRVRISKNGALKKKMELAKREQVDRFTKIAAPSGLLNELNPGIINHVRNSKQVHSIIEALVRSEKLENAIQSRSASQSKRGAKDISDRRKDPGNMHDSGASRVGLSHEDEPSNTLAGNRQTRGYSMSLNRPTIPLSSEHKGGVGNSDIAERRVFGETSGASDSTSAHKDNTFTLKLSSSVTMASGNMSFVSNEESANQASVSSLSVQAATVASQWLELLCEDIRGRLAALWRSKKRVQAVIKTELPFLMSREFSSNQENCPYFRQSYTAGGPNTAARDMHQARWMALFDQMEMALSEEGKHLESWLKQVKEMQLRCEWGLQCVNQHGLQLGGSEDESRSKKAENSERELAALAAAASIYSTCNFIMTTENASSF